MSATLPDFAGSADPVTDEAAPGRPGAAFGRAADWLRRRVRGLAHEPFLHFIALGLVIFAAHEYAESQSTRYRIDIGPAERLRIYNSYAQQYGVPPTPSQMAAMVDRYVREEIFLREGMALHLDKDDEIVRRRIAQKYEFLQQDLGVPSDPTAEQLQAYYSAHVDRYVTPERRSFSHVFFSADQSGEGAARARALRILAKLDPSGTARAPALGDVFPGPTDSAQLSRAETQRLFGGDDFAAQLFRSPVGRWAGPYRSGFGWHLVFVASSTPPRRPDLSEIRDQVTRDFKEDARQAQNDRAYKALRARYVVRTLRDQL